MIDPFSAVSIASSGITVTTSPDYLLDALTASYVLLTLALAIIAFRSLRQTQSSLDLTRQQIELNTQQSQAAIEAVNKQIAASERQTQEALYNQHKPIAIPVTGPPSYDVIVKQQSNLRLGLGVQNKGAGVALNTFAIMAIDGLPEIFCSTCAWILVQDADAPKPFDFKVDGELSYPYNEFEGVFAYPKGVFGFARLMITYSDMFDNKYFGVFDYSNEFGWRQFNEIKRVKQRLDELVIKKHRAV